MIPLRIVLLVMWAVIAVIIVVSRIRRQRQRANVIGPLVFPHPSDARWSGKVLGGVETYVLDSVVVRMGFTYTGGLINVEGEALSSILNVRGLSESENFYALAVQREYRKRHPAEDFVMMVSLSKSEKVRKTAKVLEKICKGTP